MSVWQARGGESKDCVIIQEVLQLYWSRTRARPGEKTKLGAIFRDVKDGKAVEFTIFAGDERVASAQGTLQGAKAEADWTIALPQKSWPDVVTVTFEATCGKVASRPSQRPVLQVELGRPSFSL